MSVEFEDVQAAAAAIEGSVLRTPLVPVPRLSEAIGAEVSLKLESLQYTGSFKERGALNKLLDLERGRAGRGVIASSAGNHAQAVAFHARRLGIPATIVMPELTPFVKVERTEALGARVILHGASLSEAMEHAGRLADRDDLEFVHPYDDERIIAGQGTIALEMIEDAPDLETLIVPVGGGGLISGIAIAARSLRPRIRIIGVQAELCPAMYAMCRGESLELQTHTIADGIAVKQPGGLTLPLVRELVDEFVLVDERMLERAVETLIAAHKLMVEGAGAAALAAVLAMPEQFRGQQVGVVISGGNIDARLLTTMVLRGLKRDGRIVRLRVVIDDSPGVLATVARLIGETRANIIEIQHHRLLDAPARMAELDALIETRGRPHAESIAASLRDHGFPTEVL